MDKELIFTKDNSANLQHSCNSIILLMKEHDENGALMAAQLMMLGSAIKELVNNPIIKRSGLL